MIFRDLLSFGAAADDFIGGQEHLVRHRRLIKNCLVLYLIPLTGCARAPE